MVEEQNEMRTSALLQRLFRTQDLQSFLQQNESAMQVPAFYEYLGLLCHERATVPERIIKKALIDRTYGHQLFNGTRKPSRDKVLQLAFGFELDVDEAQKLLKIADKSALYPKIKRDAVILYCLSQEMDIFETQDALQTLGLTILGGEWLHGQ